MEMLKKAKKFFICLITSLMLMASFGFADSLDTVPADSLFCVKINNFDATMAKIDQFSLGLIPMVVPSQAARAHLFMRTLGNPTMQGLNTGGDVIIFGMAREGSPEPAVIAMLPVKDYSQFVSASQNVSEPNENGVSSVKGPGMGNLVAVKAGNYALLGEVENTSLILAAAKGSKGLADSLDASQKKLSSEAPIWIYGDIDQINKSYGRMIEMSLGMMQQQMQAMSPAGGSPQEIAQITKLLKKFLAESDYVSIAIDPEPDVLNIKKTFSAEAGTEMANMFAKDSTLPKTNKLIGYMEDGAAMNFSAKLNKSLMLTLIDVKLDTMRTFLGDEVRNQLNGIAKELIASTGGTMAVSVKPNSDKPPFAVTKVVQVRDKDGFKQAYSKAIDLITGDVLANLSKAGLKAEGEYIKGASSYKGVDIDLIDISLEAVDAGSPQAQMIMQKCGDRIEIKTAMAGDYFVVAVGADTRTAVKGLIDSVKAGEKTLTSEVQTAVTMLDGADEADFVGTANIIRLMQITVSMAPMPMSLPFDQMQTSSNVAFAGDVGDGKAVIDVAVPKKHLSELFMGFMMMQMQPKNQPQPQVQP